MMTVPAAPIVVTLSVDGAVLKTGVQGASIVNLLNNLEGGYKVATAAFLLWLLQVKQ